MENKEMFQHISDSLNRFTTAMENSLKIIKFQFILFFAVFVMFLIASTVMHMWDTYQSYNYDDFPETNNINNNSISNQ